MTKYEIEKERRLQERRDERNAAERRLLKGKWAGFELEWGEDMEEFDLHQLVTESQEMQAFPPGMWDALYSLCFDAVRRAHNTRRKVPAICIDELRHEAVMGSLLFWQDWPRDYQPTGEEIHLKIFKAMDRAIGRYIQKWKRVGNGGRINGVYPQKLEEEEQEFEGWYEMDLVEMVDADRRNENERLFGEG